VIRKIEPFFAAVDEIGADSSRISKPCSFTTYSSACRASGKSSLNASSLRLLTDANGSASMRMASHASSTCAPSSRIFPLSARVACSAAPLPIVRGSALGALNGEAKWEKSIDELMEAVDKNVPLPARDIDKPFLMPIEDIFSISGRGTVVTGRIERGKVKVGEEVEIVGFRETRKTVVTGVEMFKKQLDEGLAGDNAGLLLRGTAKEDVERGMVLAKPGSITPHTKFKAEVYVLTKEEGGRHTPFFKGYRPQFYFRTTDVTGVAELPAGTEMVMPGDNVALTIELITPVAMEKGLRFAIREGGRTVGAGTISEILA